MRQRNSLEESINLEELHTYLAAKALTKDNVLAWNRQSSSRVLSQTVGLDGTDTLQGVGGRNC